MLKRLWRSTFGLIAIVTVALSITTLGIGIAAFRVTHEALEEQLGRRIATETSALLAELQDDGLSGLADEIRLRESARSSSSLEYLLLDVAGNRLAGNMVPDSPPGNGYQEHFGYRREGTPGLAEALATRIPGGILVVAASRAELAGIDRTLASLFLGALSAMLVAGIGSAALIGLATRRRISRIESTARAIVEGELTRRVPRDGSQSEFDRLAGVLNQMLDRIGGLIDNLRQVSADVAHDLRTPLTRLYNNLDRALVEPDPASAMQRIQSAKEQAAALLEIFSAILRISEIEGMGMRLPRQPLDLSLLVEQMADSYRPDVEDSRHVLRCNVEPGIAMNGDARLLNQAIANLLDNSLRHTPPQTLITLSLERTPELIRITVQDDGPGVEDSEVNRLFQRFARSERSRSTPGHGLGLALVAAVVTAHGGSASIEAAGGFRVVLEFPAAHGRT